MGILNLTPDSFSDGGLHADPDRAVAHARRMLAAGALVIDVGGESSRPGAEPVGAEVELDRVLPVIRALVAEAGMVVSVDTSKPEVAAAALAAGAHLVNDIRGLRDPAMRALCAEAGVPAVVMHMQGEPGTMQKAPEYDDVVGEVADFLAAAAAEALAAGVPSVMVDPGIGFGKSAAHSLALLRGLDRLVTLGQPVLLGVSRKGLLGRWTGVADPAARDPASIAAHLYCAGQGVAMLRVHDVAGHAQAIKVWSALEEAAHG